MMEIHVTWADENRVCVVFSPDTEEMAPRHSIFYTAYQNDQLEEKTFTSPVKDHRNTTGLASECKEQQLSSKIEVTIYRISLECLNRHRTTIRIVSVVVL